MLDILLDEFAEGAYDLIGDKPYLVYDIETMGDIRDRTKLTCEVTYAITSTDYAADHGEGDPYIYYDDVTVKDLVQQMIDFDGYIIGYNNVSFDNPVICHYAGYSQADIDLINKKTIDLFLVVRKLTGRRIGLTKVAGALV